MTIQMAFALLSFFAFASTFIFTDALKGGTPSSRANHPYVVQIVIFESDGSYQYHCSGSLITSNHILTAGSCVYGWFEKDLRVKIADQLYEIKSYKVHPKYNPLLNLFDVAVVRLKAPVKFVANSIATIGLRVNEPGKGTSVNVVSFGPDDDQVQTLPTTLSPKNDCDPDSLKTVVTNSQLCSMPPSEAGACHQDKGAPLVLEGSQVGIFSYHFTSIYEPSCGNNMALVFTSVAQVLPWMNSNMK